MKLNYNILCIDDDISSLDENKQAFRELNEGFGIEVIYHDVDASAMPRETDPDEYLTRISASISNFFNAETYYDIILIDLHLKNNVEGHSLIKYIRDNHSIYRPVIFYSAGNPADEARALEQLTSAALESDVFGKNILITPRRQIDSMLANIAGEMQREEHKIPQVRGLLMDRVSELDASIIQAVKIKALWSEMSAENKEILLKYIKKEFIVERFKNQEKAYNRLKDLDLEGIKEAIFSDSKTIDTSTKVRILKEALRLIEGMKDKADTLNDFISEEGLNSVRNHYAHKTAAELNADHSNDKCKYIRVESRRQLKNIAEVLANFTK